MFHVEARMCKLPSQAILGSWRGFRLNASMLGPSAKMAFEHYCIPAICGGLGWLQVGSDTFLVGGGYGWCDVRFASGKDFEYLACFTWAMEFRVLYKYQLDS